MRCKLHKSLSSLPGHCCFKKQNLSWIFGPWTCKSLVVHESEISPSAQIWGSILTTLCLPSRLPLFSLNQVLVIFLKIKTTILQQFSCDQKSLLMFSCLFFSLLPLKMTTCLWSWVSLNPGTGHSRVSLTCRCWSQRYFIQYMLSQPAGSGQATKVSFLPPPAFWRLGHRVCFLKLPNPYSNSKKPDLI